MTASSKIVLTLIVLLIGVLALYYGVLSGGGADPEPASPDATRDAVDASVEGRDDAPAPRGPQSPDRARHQPGFDDRADRRDQPLLPEPGDDRADAGGEADEPDQEIDSGDAPIDDAHAASAEPLGPEAPAVDDALPPIYSEDLIAAADADETGGEDADARADGGQADASEGGDAPAELTPPEYTEYVVQENESLWTIAASWFGDGSKWDLIARANPSIDPQHLRVGMVLRLPPKDAERPRPSPDATRDDDVVRYVVQSGDSLTRIARVYYGDASLWNRIYDANRETIGDRPENLRPGMELTIPPAPAPESGSGD